MTRRMLIMGLGYSGEAISREAARRGFLVTGTKRDTGRVLRDLRVIRFDDASEAIADATHLVVTAPPGEADDPILAAYGHALVRASKLQWIGYISTTGVYGDRQGGWVDEKSQPRPGQPRSRRRRAAEESWEAMASGRFALDVFRAAGIYGPGRSALDELRAGTARRVLRPGHAFSRIHRDDIALAVTVAALNPPLPGVRVLHLADDEPAESAAVTEEAARLLGTALPPALSYERVVTTMSPMARSFWEENRRVSSQRTKAELEVSWRYPSFREGLRACLAEDQHHLAPDQGQIFRSR